MDDPYSKHIHIDRQIQTHTKWHSHKKIGEINTRERHKPKHTHTKCYQKQIFHVCFVHIEQLVKKWHSSTKAVKQWWHFFSYHSIIGRILLPCSNMRWLSDVRNFVIATLFFLLLTSHRYVSNFDFVLNILKESALLDAFKLASH